MVSVPIVSGILNSLLFIYICIYIYIYIYIYACINTHFCAILLGDKQNKKKLNFFILFNLVLFSFAILCQMSNSFYQYRHMPMRQSTRSYTNVQNFLSRKLSSLPVHEVNPLSRKRHLFLILFYSVCSTRMVLINSFVNCF